ncbi:hypothetical protein [Halpernia sp. GG3]
MIQQNINIKLSMNRGEIFRKFLWGVEGLDKSLYSTELKNYSSDINLILFEFYLNPIPEQKIKYEQKIIDYRKKEKAIGIRFFITDNNFFKKNESERLFYIIEMILEKLYSLKEFCLKKKLSLNFPALITEVELKLKT